MKTSSVYGIDKIMDKTEDAVQIIKKRYHRPLMGWPQCVRLVAWYAFLAFVGWLIFVGVTE